MSTQNTDLRPLVWAEDSCCRFAHLKVTTCAEAWYSYAQSIGADKLLGYDSFKNIIKQRHIKEHFSNNYGGIDVDDDDEIWDFFTRSSRYFGSEVYRLTNLTKLESVGRAIQEGLDNGWIAFNLEKREYEVMRQNNTQIDLTGLMWQIALTNWDATKADLSTPQVAMMARLSLQALDAAVFPPSFSDYNTGDVEKALNKTRLVVAELSARADAERNKKLPEPS